MVKNFKIGNKIIGEGQPVFIIAEAGVNHNGNLKLAKRLIDAAAAAGADAVKFQTFNPATLITKSTPRADYQIKNERKAKADESQYDMLKRLMLPRKYHAELKKYAEKKGLIFMSAPFSLDDAIFLRRLGVKAIKVGSTDTENIPFLTHISKWGLPIILATGMSDLAAVKVSVAAMKRAGCKKLVVLHCTSNYPAPFMETNLKAIVTMKKALGALVGFSDHTVGIEADIAAVALGATVIEKHFTIDKNLPGPDHLASLNPQELKLMVSSIRHTEMAMGTGKKKPFASEIAIAKVARKSIVAAKKIKQGEIFSEKNLAIKRPGTGLSPSYWFKLIGKRANKDYAPDELINIK